MSNHHRVLTTSSTTSYQVQVTVLDTTGSDRVHHVPLPSGDAVTSGRGRDRVLSDWDAHVRQRSKQASRLPYFARSTGQAE